MTGGSGSPSRRALVWRGTWSGAGWGLAAVAAYGLAVAAVSALANGGADPGAFFGTTALVIIVGGVVGLVLGMIGGAVNGLLAAWRELHPITAALVVLVPGFVIGVVVASRADEKAFWLLVGAPLLFGTLASVLHARTVLRWEARRESAAGRRWNRSGRRSQL